VTDQLLIEFGRRRKTIDERFAEFHAKNPGVYDELARLARQAKKNGHHKIGIELLFAVLRGADDADDRRRRLQAERPLHQPLRAPLDAARA
jgi:hypothetical protein